MGRRALRKIDPKLDLSRHLLEAESLPRPWNAQAVFGRRAPLEIEVGSGKGLFLENAAETIAEHDFLGIEIARKYARFAAARCARKGLRNVCVVQGDARQLFEEVFPDGCAAAVHVYFPDPWWKKRHHKRRVMEPGFVRRIERVLSPGGALHFWTDVKDYFEASLNLLAEETNLIGPLPVAEHRPEHDRDYRTHFERRKRLAGLPVYRSKFRRAE